MTVSIHLLQAGDRLPNNLAIGGKARGLHALMEQGASVPKTLVIVGAKPGEIVPELDEAFATLRRVSGAELFAVRSSSEGEDGNEASFAGQFVTLLNVRGAEELTNAINSCLRSANASDVYGDDQGHSTGEMAVIIQPMIDAEFAGVIFTADPVSHRRDRIIIDVVRGLGEQLVSGHSQPDHFVLNENCEIVEQQLTSNNSGIGETELSALVAEAVRLASLFGQPQDLEWAADQQGKIWWLQARPITTLAADPNELDMRPPDAGDVLTRCNVSEIMPGAITPLTLSTTGRGINHGLNVMMRAAGASAKGNDVMMLCSYYGHLFINLSRLSGIAGAVMGSGVKQIGLSICGRVVPELETPVRQNLLSRIFNTISYAAYIIGAEKRRKRFINVSDGFEIGQCSDPVVQYGFISDALPILDEMYHIHLGSSAGPGAATGALHQLFAGDRETPNADDYARIARLLASMGAIEGTDLIAGIQNVGIAIAQQTNHQSRFSIVDNELALSWLNSPAAGKAQNTFQQFLQDHGHRTFRELEMRQPGWRDDPSPLIESLKATLLAPEEVPPSPASTNHLAEAPFYIRGLIKWARRTVQQRETSKSMLVAVTDVFKQAYRRLGVLLSDGGLLADPDLVFFLTHEELGELIEGDDAELLQKALQRRDIFDLQSSWNFDDIFTGKPEPRTAESGKFIEGRLTGNPVSVGVVEGIARVVNDPSEAAAIRPADILIAPITDIGWTPYFRLIAGLATDIGSSVSHGAVIAREYGLPAIVNTGIGTQVIKSGDLVRLDADQGFIEILHREDSPP